jgi:hypothetical protein
MPSLKVTALTSTPTSINDPDGGQIMYVAGSSSKTVTISPENLDQIRADLDTLATNGTISFVISGDEAEGLGIAHFRGTQISYSDVGIAVAAQTATVDIGTLPANARILGAWLEIDQVADDPADTATQVEIGTAGDPNMILGAVDLRGAIGNYTVAAGAVDAWMLQGAVALKALVTIGGAVDLDTLTAGAFTPHIIYVVLGD